MASTNTSSSSRPTPASLWLQTRGTALPYRLPGFFDPARYELAISYGRFSSPGQEKGQSYDRQEEALQAVLKQYGWKLLDQFFDAGVSAGRGKHRTVGVLSRMLRRIRRREIPTPCVLIIETFDRLTREELTTAQELFLSLVNRNMAVFTTLDGAGYDRDSLNGNPGLLFTSIGMQIGAHGVYRVMSNRSTKGWEARRSRNMRRKDQGVSDICPGWLEPNADRTGYIAKVGAKDLLDRIFSEVQSIGYDKIAGRLNAEGLHQWVTWNHQDENVWYDSTIRRIVTGRLVRGELDATSDEYQLRKRVEDGEEIEYEIAVATKTGLTLRPYPAMIDEETWQRANAAVAARATGRGRKGHNFANLLQGLGKCFECGGSMRLKSDYTNGRSYQYYRCTRNIVHACGNDHKYQYALVEKTILGGFATFALDQIHVPTDHRAVVIRREIADLQAAVAGIRKQHNWFRDLLRKAATDRAVGDVRGADVELVAEMRRLDDERDLKLAEIEGLEKTLAQVTAALPQSEHYSIIKQAIGEMDTLDEPDRYALRAKINAGLKAILSRVTFGHVGDVWVLWHAHAPNTRYGWELLFRKDSVAYTPETIEELLEFERQSLEDGRQNNLVGLTKDRKPIFKWGYRAWQGAPPTESPVTVRLIMGAWKRERGST